MPGTQNPRVVHVNVILISENPLDFRIEPSPLGSLPTGPNGELIFRNDHHPGFEIHFRLEDRTGLGYRFPPNSKRHAAVWSQLGANSCPDSEMWEVFHAKRVEVNTDGTTTLVVLNPNPRNPNPPPEGQGPFGYTLRVTRNAGSTYLPLDPGGDNQNGQVRSFQLDYAFVGLSCGAAGGAASTALSAAATATSVLTAAAIGALAGVIIAFIVRSLGGPRLPAAAPA